jgi:hypothetical protein
MINKRWILTNPLTRHLYPRVLHFLDHESIERKLQDIALEETARFIMEHMDGVPSFASDLALLKHAWQHADHAQDGLICEFGVWRGATIDFIAALTSRTVYGFDSFEGLPERWRDGFERGHFKLARLPKVSANVRLVEGWFDKSLPVFLIKHSEMAAFIHIDCDLYSSTKTVLDLLGDRIVGGTVIVFDELFNYTGWQKGEYKAFQEFIASTGHTYEWLGYCRYHSQAAVRILSKPASVQLQ